MNKKKEIVPKLRFPEFMNEDEWKNKRIKQLLTIGNGCDYKHLSKGDIPVYGSGGYMCSVDDFLYDGDSVCIGRKGTIDKPIFLRGKFWTVDTLFYTHSYKNCIPKFVYNVFQKINWLKYNEAGGVPSLSKTTINKINIYIPKIPEQQKIVDCLSSIDELIDAENRKLKALEKHKKGLMQKLFPAEGKTLPEWRFPEFQGCGEWNIDKLGNLCKITTGKLDANAMVANGKYRFYTCAKEFFQIDKYAFNTEALLISGNGANVGYIHYYKGKFNAYQRTYVLDQFYEDIHYIQYYLERNLSRRINTEKNEGNTPYIVLKTLTDMDIFFPKDLKEQQKIAECLSVADTMIEEQSNKVEQLKAHKKGLMQGLFPSLEEVDI